MWRSPYLSIQKEKRSHYLKQSESYLPHLVWNAIALLPHQKEKRSPFSEFKKNQHYQEDLIGTKSIFILYPTA